MMTILKKNLFINAVRNFLLLSSAVCLMLEVNSDPWPCFCFKCELVPSCGHFSCCVKQSAESGRMATGCQRAQATLWVLVPDIYV